MARTNWTGTAAKPRLVLLVLVSLSLFLSLLVGTSTAQAPTTPDTDTNADTNADADACVTDPTSMACASFTLPDAAVDADLDALCTAMPNMVGCSLRTACNASSDPSHTSHTSDTSHSSPSSVYCEPFTLLATICDEMPAMRGCSTYNSVCQAGSLVPQCKNNPPVPYAPTTREATDTVVSMCSTHGMVGCETCTSAAKCPHPLDTLSQICLGMPYMEGCRQFYSMCNVVRSSESGGGDGATASTFNGICEADSSSSDYLPPMRMWLHTGITDIVLIKEWVPTDGGYYFGTLVACFAAALLCQYLKAAKIEQEIVWASKRPVLPCRNMACGSNVDELGDMGGKGGGGSAPCCGAGAGGSSLAPPRVPSCCAGNADGREEREERDEQGSSGSNSSSGRDVPVPVPVPAGRRGLFGGTLHALFGWCAFSKPQFQRNIIRSLFTAIIVFLDYMLMLIVMTFNIGIILAVVFGFMVGSLLLGHTGEKAGSIHAGGASANVDPTDELDVRFMEAPACCGTTGFI